MDRYSTLQARWRPSWSKDTSLRRIEAAFNRSITAADEMAAERAALARAGKLSHKGLTDEIGSYARKETVPVLRRAAFEAERLRTEIGKKREALTVPAPDPSNIAAALLRGEVRAWLRGLPQGAVAGILLAKDADPTILQAAFEVPGAMLGFTDEFRASMQERILEGRYGPELEKLEDLAEAATLVESTVSVVAIDIAQNIGQDPNSASFHDWMVAASAETDRKLGLENRKPEFTIKPAEDTSDLARTVGDIISQAIDQALDLKTAA